MNISLQRNGLAARSLRGTLLLGTVAGALLLAGTATTRADEHMVLVDKIDVGGNGLGAFDISFVDPTIDLYVLADRTNASVDLFDASDATFIGRVGGFVGVAHNPDGTANNNLSGPDGVVVVASKEVWAGDGDSTVKVIDLATKNIVDTISTGGKFRCDEMAWDSADHLLAVANNADDPPFVTMINTDTHQITGKIIFDKADAGVDAQNGIEQPQWSPKTGLFYVSVPQVGPDTAQGGVSVIDPHTNTVVATFLVQQCSPAGLTLGPNEEALIGCSASFGQSPNVVTQSLVIKITNGDVVANITEVGGSDEVWYDRGSGHYYLAARSNTDNTGKITPVLGTVDARGNVFDGTVPTSTTAHSVAADKVSHHVFVPIGFVPPGSAPGTDPTNPCPDHGCIAVYLPSSIDDDDGGKLAKR
jgi:hypothetical protein